MPTKKRNLTNASYLDRLGAESAERYAPVILKQVAQAVDSGQTVTLPLDANDLHTLEENTVRALVREGKLPTDWEKVPDVRRQVFYDAWYKTMGKKGLA